MTIPCNAKTTADGWPFLERGIRPLFNILGTPPEPPRPANEFVDEYAELLQAGLNREGGWECAVWGAHEDVMNPLRQIFHLNHHSPGTPEAHRKFFEAVKPAIKAGVTEAIYYAFLPSYNDNTYGNPLACSAPELAEEIFEMLLPLIEAGNTRAIYASRLYAEWCRLDDPLANRISEVLSSKSAASPKNPEVTQG